MSRKPRKPLDDSLAQDFVFGQANPEEEAKPAAPATPKQEEEELQPVREQNLLDKLQTAQKEPTVRFTVDMPESMHRKLSILAAKMGKKKKAEIVRVVLEEALKNVD